MGKANGKAIGHRCMGYMGWKRKKRWKKEGWV
jgi:hypothetical protein